MKGFAVNKVQLTSISFCFGKKKGDRENSLWAHKNHTEWEQMWPGLEVCRMNVKQKHAGCANE